MATPYYIIIDAIPILPELVEDFKKFIRSIHFKPLDDFDCVWDITSNSISISGRSMKDATYIDEGIMFIAEKYALEGFAMKWSFKGDNGVDFFGPTKESIRECEILWECVDIRQRLENFKKTCHTPDRYTIELSKILLGII